MECNLSCLYPSAPSSAIDLDRLAQICREETEENQTLCAGGVFSVREKDGYYYLEQGHHRALGAAAAGKVFAQVGSIRFGEQQEAAGLSMQDMEAYEQAGKFRYTANPVQLPRKDGYMVDFSRVFTG